MKRLILILNLLVLSFAVSNCGSDNQPLNPDTTTKRDEITDPDSQAALRAFQRDLPPRRSKLRQSYLRTTFQTLNANEAVRLRAHELLIESQDKEAQTVELLFDVSVAGAKRPTFSAAFSQKYLSWKESDALLAKLSEESFTSLRNEIEIHTSNPNIVTQFIYQQLSSNISESATMAKELLQQTWQVSSKQILILYRNDVYKISNEFLQLASELQDVGIREHLSKALVTDKYEAAVSLAPFYLSYPLRNDSLRPLVFILRAQLAVQTVPEEEIRGSIDSIANFLNQFEVTGDQGELVQLASLELIEKKFQGRCQECFHYYTTKLSNNRPEVASHSGYIVSAIFKTIADILNLTTTNAELAFHHFTQIQADFETLLKWHLARMVPLTKDPSQTSSNKSISAKSVSEFLTNLASVSLAVPSNTEIVRSEIVSLLLDTLTWEWGNKELWLVVAGQYRTLIDRLEVFPARTAIGALHVLGQLVRQRQIEAVNERILYDQLIDIMTATFKTLSSDSRYSEDVRNTAKKIGEDLGILKP